MSTQQGPVGIAEGLARLTGVLADEAKRASFAENPEKALSDAGVPPGVLPREVTSALGSLTPDQLGAVAAMCEEMINSGMYLQLPNDGGKLCFL